MVRKKKKLWLLWPRGFGHLGFAKRTFFFGQILTKLINTWRDSSHVLPCRIKSSAKCSVLHPSTVTSPNNQHSVEWASSAYFKLLYWDIDCSFDSSWSEPDLIVLLIGLCYYYDCFATHPCCLPGYLWLLSSSAVWLVLSLQPPLSQMLITCKE